MAFIVKGLVSDGTLPTSAKQNLATDIETTGSTVRAALDAAGLGKGASDADIAAFVNDPATATGTAVETKVATATANKIEATAAGFVESPAIVQQPTLAPAEIDKRQIHGPERVRQVNDRVVAGRRNLWRRTEDLSTGYSTTSATRNTADTIVADGITLTRFTCSNLYGSLFTSPANIVALGLTPGNRYLASYYVYSKSDREQFAWSRYVASANGSSGHHGQKLLQSHKLHRVWSLVEATATGVKHLQNPTVGYSSDTGDALYWIFQGSQTADNKTGLDLYIGGFQIESAGPTAKNGIIGIGSSSMAGASGATDSWNAREWMGYLAGLLNANTYNRGVGGNTTQNMIDRWATDITPMKGVSKYVIIQAAQNDLGLGTPLATIQANTQTLVDKAVADGLIPVLLTTTPSISTASDPAKLQARADYNSWLMNTFQNVIDVSPTVEDPFDPRYLRREKTGDWYGDGVHYGRAAKRAVAEKIASWPGWDLPTPTTYQKVAGDTYVENTGVFLKSPNGTQYRIAVDDTGALTAAAA